MDPSPVLGAAVLGVVLACSYDSGIGGVGTTGGETTTGPVLDTPTTTGAAEDPTTSGGSGAADPGTTGELGTTTTTDAATDATTTDGMDDVTTACSPDCPVRYRRVFVTKATFPGGFIGDDVMPAFDLADAHCQQAAVDADLPVLYGTTLRFRAWISDDGVAPHDRFMAEPDEELPYYLVDGETRIATSWGQFAAKALENPISMDETGAVVTKATHPQVWTGTAADGQAAELDPMSGKTNCDGWTASVSSLTAVCGSPYEKTESWTDQTVCMCHKHLPFYCIEDDDG